MFRYISLILFAGLILWLAYPVLPWAKRRMARRQEQLKEQFDEELKKEEGDGLGDKDSEKK